MSVMAEGTENQNRIFYIVYSMKTGGPYITKKRGVYICETKEAAEKIVQDKKHTCVEESDADMKHILSTCYAAGAKTVYFCRENGDVDTGSIIEDSLERRYYNGRLNADIALYAHTKNNDYLRDLMGMKFIVPICITNHPIVSVVYSTVSTGGPYLYLAFTDLEEYNKWGYGKEEWMPLLVDYEGLRRIGKRHGFLVNVFGMKLVINRSIFRKIKGEEE